MAEEASNGIFEIRDYTIEPDWLDPYRAWARDHAVPWLMASDLEVIDFWVDDGEEALVTGSAPSVSPNGQPNVCWIIRWPSRQAREEGYAAFTSDPGWQEVWAKHPNPRSYLHINVRFMRSVA